MGAYKDFFQKFNRKKKFTLFSSFSLSKVLCDPSDLIFREGTLFEAMNGRITFINGLLAEFFGGFPQL